MTTTTTTQKSTTNRKRIGGLAAIATAGALLVGGGFAFFSDGLTFGGTATAGTLDLVKGEQTFQQSNGSTHEFDDFTSLASSHVANFNPGDVFEMTTPVTNEGNKSAWIRAAITDMNASENIQDHLYIYSGAEVPEQSELMAASGEGDLGTLPGFIGTAAAIEGQLEGNGNGNGVGPSLIDTDVINGSGANAETEDAADGRHGIDTKIVVFFDSAATNEAQAGTFDMTASVEAVQYRNNPTPSWDNVDFDWTLPTITG